MENITIGNRRWHLVFLFVIYLLLTMAGLALIVASFAGRESEFSRGAFFAGVTNALFWGGAACFFFYLIKADKPRLIIDESGITDRSLNIGQIEWSDISQAYIKVAMSNTWLCLEVTDPEKYFARFSALRKFGLRLNKPLGLTPFSMNLSHIGVDPYEVCDHIQRAAAVARVVQS